MCLGQTRLQGGPALVHRDQKEARPLCREKICERLQRLFVLCGRQLHLVQLRETLRKWSADDDGAAQGSRGCKDLCAPHTFRSTGAD
jgi:hypothetical protein